MSAPKRILIVDDDRDLLELYRELLIKLPCTPEVHTADSGARALALFESVTFDLFITDLNMPRMDGFQLLTVVRKKYMGVKTVVISGVSDEQFRARAYAMGIDLYLEKPSKDEEIKMFVECIESLLEQEQVGGFRGVQSMTLVDLIQAECMAGSTCVLKITNAGIVGKIWIVNGDVVDSEAYEESGEAAFIKILGWKSGSFEKLPGEENRERTIMSSYQGLLLDSAQSLDQESAEDSAVAQEGEEAPAGNVMGPISRVDGVELALSVKHGSKDVQDTWGVEDPKDMTKWTIGTMSALRELGEKLNVGQLNHVIGVGTRRHVIFLPGAEKDLCVGLRRGLGQAQLRNTMRDISTKWDSYDYLVNRRRMR